MNAVKKWMGLVWMLAGPLAIYYLVKTAAAEIGKKPVMNTKIQWGVFIVVFVPIAIGLVIFGWYAWKNEYDKLPVDSSEV
jgi:predicted Na+-dependent transporter